MTVSLNEVEATAKKAARGAGHTWGMAEEAAKATRWLCRHGVDGCAALARLLTTETGDIEQDALKRARVWRPVSAPLCPLNVGASMADLAHELIDEPRQVGHVTCPSLLIPFAADIASKTGKTVALSGAGFTALTDGETLNLVGQMPYQADQLVFHTTASPLRPNGVFSRSDPAKPDWAMLQELAHRTYAPATEASRLKGAGAGMTDND
ncbi:DUF3726 domain-containing protein [uncultured Pelagimonas sp.]|uniref:DUF3726 domain-containing protein n=1 Tax=uncultured Pelagimonas sp. TaxID=1618102 RepID=UPI0026060BBF|nr:DUF3726 domain-containing protein [uncultured Pelagimonas sp.]